MLTVLRLLHWPFWKRSPLGALLPALGVSLGVAAIVAVDLAGASAVASFRETIERLDGRTTHRVEGDAVPDGLARRLAKLPGVEAAAPVLERTALYLGEGWGGSDNDPAPLRLLGVDPLAERQVRLLGMEQAGGKEILRDLVGRPGALLVSGPFLDRHGLRAGDPLPLALGAVRARGFVLSRLPAEVGGLEVPPDLAIGDIATVQELAEDRGGVDRVDLVIPQPGRDAALARVRASLPPGTRLERPGGRAARLERTLGAFRANVRALSYLALFVSFFLIYDSLLLSVLRRRPLLGTVRCLGATRRQVLGGWLVEALATGVAGVALGTGLGLLFARPALAEVSRTAADLYGAAGSGSLSIVPATLLKAACVGLSFTLLSALLPVLEAAATPPARTSARSGVERVARRRRGAARVAALLLAAATAVALAWPTASSLPGYAAAIALALVAALLVPDGMELLLAPLLWRRLRSRRGILRLAAANIRANLSRTGVAVAALTIALAMAVGMGTLVGSFRHELESWITDTVGADLYVSPAGLETDRQGATLPEGLADRFVRLPLVEAVATYRERPARVAGRDAFLGATDVAATRGRVRWSVLSGGTAEAFFDALEAGGAGVTEALHRKTGIGPGERIGVEMDGRVDSLTVAAVYRDYSTESGIVLVDRRAYAHARDLGPPRSLALFLAPGADVGAAELTVREAAGPGLALIVRTRGELRARALAIFERTFSITRVLEVVGLAVAAIGILGALLAMLLERTRELATLRALGLTRRQLGALFLAESTLLALMAWAFALATGGLMAWVLLSIINVRSFGWALDYRLPWATWGVSLAASLAASWAATLWPLWRLGRMDVAPLLREE